MGSDTRSDTQPRTMGGNPEADLTLAYSPIDVTGLEFTGGRMALSDMAFTLNYGFSGSLIRRKQQYLGNFGYARPSGPRSRTACSRSISTPIPLIRAALTSCPPG